MVFRIGFWTDLPVAKFDSSKTLSCTDSLFQLFPRGYQVTTLGYKLGNMACMASGHRSGAHAGSDS